MRHARQPPEAMLQHAVPDLVDVARGAPRLALDPGPALVAPVRRVVVAAILDELAELRPGDGLCVDLELGNGDGVWLALVVETKARTRRRRAASVSPERAAAAATRGRRGAARARPARPGRRSARARRSLRHASPRETAPGDGNRAHRRSRRAMHRAGRGWSRATRPGTGASPPHRAARSPPARDAPGARKPPGRTRHRRRAGSRRAAPAEGRRSSPRLRCTLRPIQSSWNQAMWPSVQSGGSISPASGASSGRQSIRSPLVASNAAAQASVRLRASIRASESTSLPALRRRAWSRSDAMRSIVADARACSRH